MINYKGYKIQQNVYTGTFFLFIDKNIIKTSTLKEMQSIIDARETK
jgi:hypothetical protein